MNVSKPKEAAGLPIATTQGKGTATISTVRRPINTFTRIGSISKEKHAIRIDYESFGEARTAYIGAAGVRSLCGPANYPCDIEEITEDPVAGTMTIVQIGRAWRSKSGRALVLKMIRVNGELMTPWSQFRRVVDGQVQKAIVSIFNPNPVSNEPVKNPVSKGLEGAF